MTGSWQVSWKRRTASILGEARPNRKQALHVHSLRAMQRALAHELLDEQQRAELRARLELYQSQQPNREP